ncbi:DUF2607 family protein [Marinomonas pollencensis]|uniref:Uncharacterized protein DUF2607 n=1 Tax=Marinomonas pollencensis TaxID=491954 RepID=A0A3E0DIQ7_9GAMM|nr:DUF2607 family protein [Marinomonas pollencensis]REG81967.1 uncharacterized protein DUF2607 [Marinomonas pollencensis]
MQKKQQTLVQVLCCVLLVILLGVMSSVHDTDIDEGHHQHHQCEMFHFSQQWLPASEFVWPVVWQAPQRSLPLLVTFFSIVVFISRARAPPSLRSIF